MNTAGESYFIPYGIRKIGDRAFANIAGDVSIVVPSSVVNIADNAFENSHVTLILVYDDEWEIDQLEEIADWADSRGFECEMLERFWGNG